MNDATMQAGTAVRSAGYRALISVLLAGLGLFSFGDHFYHVRNGLLSYNVGPYVDGQSVLVWLVFIAGAALILAVTSLFTKNATPSSLSELVLPFVLVHAAYFSSGVWGVSHPTELTLALVALWVVRIALTSEYRAQIVVLSLLLAVSGPLCEGLLSMWGFFDYAPALKQFFGVPYWLACVYLNGGPLAVTIARWVRAGLPQATPANLSHGTTA
ncbi:MULTISPECIES: DUF2878 domain-containing protein [Burkholderia]|uniref:DUF2878 domain-containing protein n=1 Tax=Burkholderia TaxID=32008 RepID=UPI00158F6693|nr:MULTISPECIES: DUF2878 domain-containing protein [Burkholderia]MBR8208629.1 DUF2878 domain-containing protein [Burkholderia cenocepacia]MCA8235637.1 DUF2878 domain-containing protein [Burkholderia cenocepacia]